MKQYLVVEDANAFAAVMNRRYPERFYTVFKMNNTTEEGK